MRASGTHIVVHTRVQGEDPETAEYIGSKAFSENVKSDSKDLRNSYQNPLPARVSLSPTTETDTPVGYIFSGGVSRWYIVDQETEDLVYIELNAFFRAGEGDKEHLQFWNPLTNKLCRATFLGNERPQPPSPDPLPSNLEASVSHLTIDPPRSATEWVRPELRLDKKTNKPVLFITASRKEKRTGWEKWELRSEDGRMAFLYLDSKTEKEYWAERLPGEWVTDLRRKNSSDRPVRFHNKAGTEIKTKETRWIAGRGGTFYVYMEQGCAYLTFTLPP